MEDQKTETTVKNNKEKELVLKYGGISKFARRINAPIQTINQWFYGLHKCRKWTYDILEWALERGFYSPDYKELKPKPKCLYQVDDGENILYYGRKLADAKDIIRETLAEIPEEPIFLSRNGTQIWNSKDNLMEELKVIMK